MQNIFIELLPPWVETGLQPAFYDKESGTVLQQTARMYARVNQLTQAFNTFSEDTADTVNDYIERFTTLHNYVHDYFDNLDVQEEINNKLDEMVEAGTLQSLFIGYGLEIGDDNKVKVKAGDGITVNESGVSISTYENFIPDVEVKTFEYSNNITGSNTTIYYSRIPSTYKPQLIMADESDPDVRKRPSEFDYNYLPTLMLNAGPWDNGTNTTYGPLIVDGDVKVENNLTGGTNTDRTILGIEENGNLKSINGATNASDVTTPDAVRVWYTVIDNGLDKTGTMTAELEPRSFIAQSTTGEYIIGTCGGRTYDDNGMSKSDIANFLFYNVDNFEPRVAFSLDGGGSSCLMYKGIRQNPLINNENRRCPNYIIFKSETAKDKSLFEAQAVNNAKIIEESRDKSTAWFSTAKLQSLLGESVASSITVEPGSVGRIINGVIVCLNMNITLSATVTSYSYLFEHLPEFSGGSTTYFTMTLLDGTADTSNRVCQVYLQNATGKGGCIRNRYPLPAGKYEINICYLTQP